MKNIHRYIRPLVGPLVLAAVIATPVLIATQANAQEASVQVRVYDRNHKDYHNWDDREDRAYRGYLTENHREYREYNRQKRRDQESYWKWRHNHPDHD
jgi:type III secretory pathway component EscR